MAINRSTPLWKIVDGVTHSWSVLDPLENAAITIRLQQPVTVERLAVWLTISPGLAVAKEVAFEGDGKPLLTAMLEAKKGGRSCPACPCHVSRVEADLHSTYPGQNEWGSISEIEGLDKPVRTCCSRRRVAGPGRTESRAGEIPGNQNRRPDRPVFMTVTAISTRTSANGDQQRNSLYAAYFQAADIVGYDIYPIYGWNKPEWIHLVRDATELLAKQAGQRPLYAWIETSKGGQWTGPLENQKEVTPAHIKAEVWMAICRSARPSAILRMSGNRRITNSGPGRKPHGTAGNQCPDHAAGAGHPERRTGAGRNDPQFHRRRLDVLAKRHAGSLYLFAVNYDERNIPAEAAISAAGLAAGTEIEVLDEDRVLRAEAGGFRDDFAPLAVHLYRHRGKSLTRGIASQIRLLASA